MSVQPQIPWPDEAEKPEPPAKPEAPVKRGPPFGRTKYLSKPSFYRGIRYDSKAEAARAAQLDLLKRAGDILWWKPKPGTFHLGCPENGYRPDFLVVARDKTWVEDTKGVRTEKFKSNLRLWKVYGPCDLVLINRKKREVIPGGGAENPMNQGE